MTNLLNKYKTELAKELGISVIKMTNLLNKYERTLEILDELGKVNIDFIENLDETFDDLKKLGFEPYIENDYLKLEYIKTII